MPFRLYVEARGTSKDRQVFTVMSVEVPGLPAGLAIYRENAFLKITKVFGAQDVATGDPEFDSAFVVKGKDPESVLRWLDDSRRRAILSLFAENPALGFRKGCLHFERSQIVAHADVLEKAFQDLENLIPYLNPR